MNRPKSGARSWAWELSALFITLGGVLARCVHWPQIFTGHGVVLPGTDPYYHLWRADMLAGSLPGLMTFDPFISFPGGAPIPWPPVFDLLLALPVLLGADASSIPAWGAILVPLLGGLSVYLVYRLGREMIGPLGGLLAAGFLALMSGAIEYSHVGRVDHHAFVAPVFLGMFLSMLASLKATTPGRSIRWGCVCGLCASVAVGSFSATPPVYFLPVALTLLLLRWGPDAAFARRSTWSCLGSTFLLVLLMVLLTGDLQARPFDLYYPSWFTVLLFALLTLPVVCAYFPLRYFITAAAAGLALLAGLVFLVPDILTPLSEGMQVAGGTDLSYQMPAEASRTFLCEHDFSGRTLLGAVFTFLGIGLLLIQGRFSEYGAPAVALLLAWSLSEAGSRLKKQVAGEGRHDRAIILGTLLAIALGVALSPLVTSLVAVSKTDLTGHKRELIHFARLLGRQTPEVLDSDGQPTYGVLSAWEDSHAILQTAKRPVVVSSFGTIQALNGNRRGFGWLLASDEESAFREMATAHVRYLVVSPMTGQIPAMSAMIGKPDALMSRETVATERGLIHTFRTHPAFFGCLYTRMFYGDGSQRELQGERLQALSHLRLHLESDSQITDPNLASAGYSLPRFKAFELVPGAIITGTAEPNQVVELRLTVETNTGRRFLYERTTRSDQQGKFQLVVPYATGEAGKPYRIKIANRVSQLWVTEQDVKLGRKVALGEE
jgi:dolichyl-diphosphooligosaccharide--protein glycosyltransferase